MPGSDLLIKFHKFDVIPFNSRSNEHQYNHDISDLNCNVFNDVLTYESKFYS